MRTVPILCLLACAVAAGDAPTVSFRLPDHEGRMTTVADLDTRYALLVYQGIP